MDKDIARLSRDLAQMALAHFVDLKGGQVTVALKDLDYKQCSVRMELNVEEKTVTFTLMTNEYAEQTLPPGGVIVKQDD